MTIYEDLAMRASKEQLGRLISACENLSARFAADACRVVVEGDPEKSILPWLENLSIGDVREFEEAIGPILDDGIEVTAEERQLRKKYEDALAEMRESNE